MPYAAAGIYTVDASAVSGFEADGASVGNGTCLLLGHTGRPGHRSFRDIVASAKGFGAG
jgi:hypothetical protein